MARAIPLTFLFFCLLAACSDCQPQTAEVAWSLIDTRTAPPGRHDASLAVDPVSGRIFMFGGRDRETCLNDLWTFEPAAGDWKEVAAQGGPSPRSGAGLAFDPDGRRLILIGGYCHDGLGQTRFENDLWFYSEEAGWSREFVKGGPGARAWHAVTTSHGRLLMFGGAASKPLNHRNDLWALDLDDPKWIRLASDGGPLMAGRAVLVALDGGRLALFGRDGIPKPRRTGRWLLDLEQDRWSFVDSMTPKDCVPAPTFDAALADAASRRLVVLEGPDETRSGWLAWSARLDADSGWSSAGPADGPTTPIGMACAPEPARAGSWICFGGVRRDELSDRTWRLEAAPDDRPEGVRR